MKHSITNVYITHHSDVQTGSHIFIIMMINMLMATKAICRVHIMPAMKQLVLYCACRVANNEETDKHNRNILYRNACLCSIDFTHTHTHTHTFMVCICSNSDVLFASKKVRALKLKKKVCFLLECSTKQCECELKGCQWLSVVLQTYKT